jgi:preprotein translocase subunit YajC
MKTNWWYESGLAAQAAQELVWFVVLVFVGIGVVIWFDIRKEKKNEQRKKDNTNW